MNELSDPGTERSVLAGICHYGQNIYLTAIQDLEESTFTVLSNQVFFRCCKRILGDETSPETIGEITQASIISAAASLGLEHFFENQTEFDHLRAIFSFPKSSKEEVGRLARKLKQLQKCRDLTVSLTNVIDKIKTATGEEPFSEIVNTASDVIFNISNTTNNQEYIADKIADDIEEHIDNLVNNPNKELGLSTGMERYDKVIGGGLAGGTINIIGARSGVGKSMIANNIANHLAIENAIPVLYIDTEMKKGDQMNRLLAMRCQIPINDIKKGLFKYNEQQMRLVEETREVIKICSYHHRTVAGLTTEDQVSIMRTWLMKEVGLKPTGESNPCLIIVDYLKIMDAKEIASHMQEYQSLGFLMSNLHNFAVRYNIPILALVQTNRDGIDKDSSDVISGSDRILWLASSLAILRDKTEKEMQENGAGHGNKKMSVIKARHGTGTKFNEYINFQMNGKYGEIKEGKTNLEIVDEKKELMFELKEPDIIPNENKQQYRTKKSSKPEIPKKHKF